MAGLPVDKWALSHWAAPGNTVEPASGWSLKGGEAGVFTHQLLCSPVAGHPQLASSACKHSSNTSADRSSGPRRARGGGGGPLHLPVTPRQAEGIWARHLTASLHCEMFATSEPIALHLSGSLSSPPEL